MTDKPRSAAALVTIPVLLSLAGLLALAGGAHWTHALQYDRQAVLQGQWWRLISGNFVHLGASHLVMNLVGLWVMWLLIGSCWRLWQWLVIAAACAFGVGAGLLWFDPGVAWYVGLSGLLHGLLAAGAVAMLAERSWLGAVLAAVVAGKLVWEQLWGALPGSAEWAHGVVIVDAHLCGALTGALTGLVLAAVQRCGGIGSRDGSRRAAEVGESAGGGPV